MQVRLTALQDLSRVSRQAFKRRPILTCLSRRKQKWASKVVAHFQLVNDADRNAVQPGLMDAQLVGFLNNTLRFHVEAQASAGNGGTSASYDYGVYFLYNMGESIPAIQPYCTQRADINFFRCWKLWQVSRRRITILHTTLRYKFAGHQCTFNRFGGTR